jgi:hypothetical protein
LESEHDSTDGKQHATQLCGNPKTFSTLHGSATDTPTAFAAHLRGKLCRLRKVFRQSRKKSSEHAVHRAGGRVASLLK